MNIHAILLLCVTLVWLGSLGSLLLWGSWRLAAAWTASAGLTGYAAWLHAMLNAALDIGVTSHD